jgi:hypothetical protein
VTGGGKLAYTALLFAGALGLLAVAAATHSAIPLFFMWLPLLGVPWVLARPETGPPSSVGRAEHSPNAATDAGAGEDDSPSSAPD